MIKKYSMKGNYWDGRNQRCRDLLYILQKRL